MPTPDCSETPHGPNGHAQGVVSPAAPAAVAEAIRACQDYVRRSIGLELDFTSDTLPLLDHYCLTASTELAATPELLPLLGQAVGAYFGAVMATAQPGFWIAPSADVHTWRFCLTRVLLAFNPVGFAWDALSGNEEHAGPSSQLYLMPEDAERVRARLAAVPPVSPRDYLRLSTRFDALELAHAELMGDAHADPESLSWYEPEDYEDLFSRLGR